MPQLAIGFGLCAALVLLSAVWVVTLRNLFRAALSLGLVLIGIAGLFLMLEAEFIAFAQILVYVGAVLTLVVFAIMLTARQTASSPPALRRTWPAVILSSALFAILVRATQPLPARTPQPVEAIPLAALGQTLVTTWVLPFEVVSLVVIAAIVGAVAIATARKPRPHA